MKAQPYPRPTDFDSALEFCLSAIRLGRMTRDECLALYPDFAVQLQPLLRRAASLTSMPRPVMQPEVRKALEWRLRARMAQVPAPRRAPPPRTSLTVRWASIVIALTLALGMAGLATLAAAASSLPGDFLYPVKRWSETVSVQFANDADRAGVHLSIAQRRLNEFEALTERGEVDVALLDEVVAETHVAIAASAALDESPQAAALTHAANLGSTAIRVVSSVRSRANEAALDGLDRSLTALADVRAAALDHMPPSQLPPTATGTSHPTRTSTPGLSDTAGPRPSDTPTPTDDDALADDQTPAPPGRGTPGGGLTKTPSGQGTPSGPPHTPLGQDNTPGPPNEPAGQDDKPTKTPKP